MFCLIAAEESIAGLIGNNLKKMNNFSEWTFEICADAARLADWSERGVDVLVLSRSLPGDDPINLLSQFRSFFPAAHIVLLVGQLTESGRSYMKAAEGSGLRNTVIGKLPGVRPYNLMVALTRPKNPELDAGLAGCPYERSSSDKKDRKTSIFSKFFGRGDHYGRRTG